MMPETLAELAALLFLVWALYRLFEPLRRRAERLILRFLDPTKADIVDTEIMPEHRKKPKE
jgi:hypothetical protein